MRLRKQEIGDKNICGIRIEQRLTALNMKQKDLLMQLQLKGIDLNSSALSKIEGQLRSVSDRELLAISEILGVSMLWLVGAE